MLRLLKLAKMFSIHVHLDSFRVYSMFIVKKSNVVPVC